MLPITHLRNNLLLPCIIYSVQEHFHTANHSHCLFWAFLLLPPCLDGTKAKQSSGWVWHISPFVVFPERCCLTLGESCVVQVCTCVISWSSCGYLWTQNLRVPLASLCLAVLKGTSWTLHTRWLTVTDEVGCDIPLAAPQHKQWEHNQSSHLPRSFAPPKLKAKWRPRVIHIFIQRTIVSESKSIHISKQVSMMRLCHYYSKQKWNPYICVEGICSWYNFMSAWRCFAHRLA